jgi:disulfide bond formation protein DsbB
MIKCCSLRISYFLAFLLTAALLLFSIYLQVDAGLQPCALCVLQRGSLIILVLIFLLGVSLKLKRFSQLLIGVLAILSSFLGIVLSGRQVWLQHLPSNSEETCAASLQYMLKVLPFDQVIQKIFHGSAECAQKGWTLLSFSIAEWSLVCFALFLVFSIWQTIRK